MGTTYTLDFNILLQGILPKAGEIIQIARMLCTPACSFLSGLLDRIKYTVLTWAFRQASTHLDNSRILFVC